MAKKKKNKTKQNQGWKTLTETERLLNVAQIMNQCIQEQPIVLPQKTYLLVPDSGLESMKSFLIHSSNSGALMSSEVFASMYAIRELTNDLAKTLGFTVITDEDECDHDGEIYELYGHNIGYDEELMDVAAAIPNLNIPLSMDINTYLLAPFFPAVFKNFTTDRGEDIYLIENQEQLEKIISILEKEGSKKLELWDEFVVQQYINQHLDTPCSLRVLITCTGEIIASSFLVNTGTPQKRRVKVFGLGEVFNPCELLNQQNSPYFIESRNITSNSINGAKRIILDGKAKKSQLSHKERELLTLHGLDINNLKLPDSLVPLCEQIALFLGSKRGLVMGLDFILDSKTDKWYYLEANRNPSVATFRDYYKLNQLKDYEAVAVMLLQGLLSIVRYSLANDMQLSKHQLL